MRFRYSIFVLTVILFISGSVFTQKPIIKSFELPREYKRQKVSCIYQDSLGWVWLAGRGLFLKFDGKNFTDIHQPVPDLTYGNVFTEGQMTYTSTNDDGFFLVSNDSLKKVPGTDSITTEITGIQTLGDHQLVSTYGEGLWVKSEIGPYRSILSQQSISKYIYKVEETAGANEFLIATDQGAYFIRVDPENRSFKVIRSFLENEIITDVYTRDQNVFWLPTHAKGIWKLELDKSTVSPVLQSDRHFNSEVNSLTGNENGLFFLNAANKLLEYHIGSGQLKELWIEKKDMRITDLFPGTSNLIWFTTSARQFYCLSPAIIEVEEHEEVSFQDPFAISSDHLNNLWISNSQGLYRHTNEFTGYHGINKLSLNTDFKTEPVISLEPDMVGNIWAGTFNNGLFRIDTADGTSIHYTMKNGLPDNNVLCIEANEKYIWVSSFGGLARIALADLRNGNAVKFESFSGLEKIGNGYVYDIYTDRSGKTWFATDGNGVAYFKDGNFYRLNDAEENAASVVYFIAEDRFGDLWFGTPKKGLYKHRNDSLVKVASNDRYEDEILGLHYSQEFGIVLLEPDGIELLDPKTLTVKKIGAAFGVTELDPKLNASYLDQDNVLWVGTSQGTKRLALNKFGDPGNLPCKLTSAQLFFKPVKFREVSTFAHDENHLTFQFTSFWYLNAQSIQYEYKLEGHDLNWVTTEKNEITYPALPPGTYTFKVRASAVNDFSKADEVSYRFTIAKPFWKTAWFIGLMILLVAGIIVLVVKVREHNLVLEKEKQREIAHFQLETIKSQVNPHFLFNSFLSLIEIIETEPPKAVVFVEKLSHFFRKILAYRDKNLITLGEEIELCKNYLYMQEQRFPNGFKVNWNVTEDSQRKMIPPICLQILLENAFKHNEASEDLPLEINISTVSDGTGLKIENKKQSRYKIKDSTGIGLDNLKKQYQMFSDKQPVIEDTEQTFSVVLPLIEVKENGYSDLRR